MSYREVVWQPVQSATGASPVLRWPNRTSSDVTDFGLNLDAWPVDAGETITDFQYGTDAIGLVISGSRIDGLSCVITIAGGIPGTTASIDFVVTSSAGRIQAFTVLLATVDHVPLVVNPLAFPYDYRNPGLVAAL